VNPYRSGAASAERILRDTIAAVAREHENGGRG
jgi:hypothetical protein